jgi:hypothetical protein
MLPEHWTMTLDFVIVVPQLLCHRSPFSYPFSFFSFFLRHLHLTSLNRLPTLQEPPKFLIVLFFSVPS